MINEKYNNLKHPKVGYKTGRGIMIQGSLEAFLESRLTMKYHGKVQLIFASLPFSLSRKKKYGNLTGEEYLALLRQGEE